MMKRKLLSLLVAVCVVFGTGILPVPALGAANPGYKISGEVSGGKFNVTVSVSGAKVYGGKLALAYDTDLLALADTSSLGAAVKKGEGVTLTTEGHAASVLLEKGRVMFAWYSSAYSGIDASDGAVIATISFDLTGDAADFSRNTLGLYYVNETMVDGWDCSAEIAANVGGSLTAYRNTEIDENYLCGMEYDYPNCDYIPPTVYNVAVRVKNSDGKEIAATVTLDSVTSETDMFGRADIPMCEGTYFYRVTSPGYEVKTGYYIVDKSDSTFDVTLRSYGQIAIDEAAALEIGYAEGDDADNVTADLVLPAETTYGTVSWTSDNSAVTDYGSVRRGSDDVYVTLTATVNVNGRTAVKEFNVVVKSRMTAAEKNAAIVATDKDNLQIGYAPGDDEDNVTVNLSLSDKGNAGSVITWESSNEDIININGAVSRPVNDTEVTLTAYIIRSGVTDKKIFNVTVKGTGSAATPTPEPDEDDWETVTPSVPQTVTDPETSRGIVSRVLEALEIGYAAGDSAESVTQKLSLATVGTDGTKIAWTSSQPAVITPYGGVVRQAKDTVVTLTAVVSHGQAEDVREFTVTVKASEIIPENPSNGQQETIKQQNASAAGGGGGGGAAPGAAETPIPTTAPEAAVSTLPIASSEPQQDGSRADGSKIRFIDIDDVPWAQNAINTLADRGVISGTSEITYSPHLSIRRADFVMLLMKLYKPEGEITDTFEDVTEDKYYYSDVSKAKSLGIISGVDETHFAPENSISRQDMMTMTYRALQRLGKTEQTKTADITAFGDYESISAYALDAVKYLVGIGAVHGDSDGNLNPLANTTRAETAVFLYGLTH